VTDEIRSLRDAAADRMRLGDPAGALMVFDRLLTLTPDDPVGQVNRGNALNRLGRAAEALAGFDRAIALSPRMAVAHSNRAQTLNTLDRFDEALAGADRALALDPGLANAWRHRGMALFRLERLDAALESFREAARLTSGPQAAEPLAEVGMVLAELGRDDEALAAYDRAAAIDPQATGVRYRRAHARLLRRDFAGGWEDYEARWQGRFADDRPVAGVAPELRRRLTLFPTVEMLRGRRVLAVAEQGIGDEIMFASVLPDLAAVAGDVACLADRRLQGLLSHSMPGVEVLAGRGPELADPARFDLIVALGSLPHAFRRAATDFPGLAYLKPADDVGEAWRTRLGPAGRRRRIGISWRGGVARTRTNVRSMELETLRPLLERPDCEFVSLQYGDVAAELATFNATIARPVLSFPAPEIDDFEQLAGLVSALDAVVTVQTAVAHLTGALGRPGLVMIPRRAEWRYGAAGEDIPWYGSLRLLRQTDEAGWAPVIDRVIAGIGAMPQSAG
jgi:Flp pilus assembly protein TadD